jgi:hypothetical protein
MTTCEPVRELAIGVFALAETDLVILLEEVIVPTIGTDEDKAKKNESRGMFCR